MQLRRIVQISMFCCWHAADLSQHVEAALAAVAVKHTLVNSQDEKDVGVQASMVHLHFFK